MLQNLGIRVKLLFAPVIFAAALVIIGIAVALGQFGSGEGGGLPLCYRAQVHDLVRGVHVEGEEAQVLFVKAGEDACDPVCLKNILRDRQRHFESLPGIADIDFELARYVGFGYSVRPQFRSGLV